MFKNVAVILLTSTLLLGAAPATSDAANLGRLLGAQRPAATSTASPRDAGRKSEIGSQRHDRPRKSDQPTSANLHHGTPIFPILSKLIKLYLLWLLLNPYR